MADSEELSAELSEKNFKCCVKKIAKIAVCVNCGSIYHKSCLERRMYKPIDETRIICCEEVNTKNKNSDSNIGNKYYNEIMKSREQEIAYLKQIIQEKEEKYNILMENKQLLDDKLKYIEAGKKPEPNKQAKNEQLSKETRTKTDNIEHHEKSANHRKGDQQIRRVNNVNQNLNNYNHTNNNSANSVNALQNAQRQIMQNVIHLEDDITTQSLKEENWQTVQYRRKFLNKKYIGQAEETVSKFQGLKPKVWMFIYRVNSNVEEVDIQNYLKEKTGEKQEQFIVKYLRSARNNLKCFKVAADFKHKENFYSPEFWPRGVGYRRFDFRKDEVESSDIQNSARPSSFLDVRNTV